jgi:hypothetical protein
MRRHSRLLVFVRKQNAAHKQAAYKRNDEHQPQCTAFQWGIWTNSPQFLIQKFQVTLVHLSTLSQYPNRRPAFDSSIYHFSKTPTGLVVEGLFYAVSLHAFGMHQRIKLAFQQVPFIGRRHPSLHMTVVSSNYQREHAFIGGLCKSVLAVLVPLRKNECPLWAKSGHGEFLIT